MDIFNELHSRMDFFADEIAKEVSEKRYYEVAEIRAIAKTRLWFAIYDCIQLQVTEKENERKKLVNEYAKAKEDRIKIGAVLSKVNAEKKEANRLLHTMKNYNEYEQLKHFVKNRIGKEVFDDFIKNYLNRPENIINKNAKNIS